MIVCESSSDRYSYRNGSFRMAISREIDAGEELNSSYVTERGLVGDRSYALIDQETGKVASAKNPRKWVKLFDFRAAFIEDPPQVVESILPPVRVTFPDGTQIFSSDQEDIDHALSKHGYQARLYQLQ
jgi:uncharacterized protein YcbX